MNTTVTTAEVQEFLTAVRIRLADLDPDEQREILDGLEADLTDLVAERGRGALGDPVDYARELRTAAGLDPQMGKVRRGMSLSDGVHSFLDDVRRHTDRLVAALPGDAGGVLTSLQPAWWVLRAWVAVEIAAMFVGDWSLTIVPGSDVRGLAAILVAAVASVQLGRGRLWPGDRWRSVAGLRVLLLGLNCFALAMIPVVLNGLDHGRQADWEQGYADGRDAVQPGPAAVGAKAGLYADGTWVSQIYPYDAKGRPLVGVQLFNQVGDPINVVTQPEYDEPNGRCVVDGNGRCSADGRLLDADGKPMPRVYYPWTNGAAQLFNVFPIPSRVQAGDQLSPTAFTDAVRPEIDPYPHATVPKVSLPGIHTGRAHVPVSPLAGSASTPSP
jgi:hypothetical protein